jgi:G8 domain-containing protein
MKIRTLFPSLAGALGTCLALTLGAPSLAAQIHSDPNCLVPLDDYWSSPSTWPGGVVPTLGSSPVITAGMTVVLDVSPPPLADLTILGTLIWKDITGLVLEANSIHVTSGGQLRIGCESSPFVKTSAIIRLSAPDCGDPGATGLFVEDGGILNLWGKPRNHSWIELASTANENQPVLALAATVNWPVGAQVAIASSDFDCEYFDLGTIASVSGSNLTLSANLTRRHFAGDVGVPPDTVPERAEVALLSRNIVVEGTLVTCPDATGPSDRYAGHVKFHIVAPDDPAPIVHLSWVEFRNLGNEAEMGNYPLHFHQIGDLSASFVDSCSLHHCFNRGLAIHDSQNLRVTDTVAFDSVGHLFYMEESDSIPAHLGPVTGCTWTNNLVFMARAAVAGNELSSVELLPDSGNVVSGPSCFWLENFDNEVLENHAAGGEGMGFWMDVPSGQTFTAGFPEGMSGNVAHSNQNSGFYFDDFPFMDLDPVTDPPLLQDLVAWKNRAYGVYARALGTMVLENMRVADNLGGMYLASAGNPKGVPDGTIQYLRDSIVLGEPLQNLGAHLGTDSFSEYTPLERGIVPARSLPVDAPWCGGLPTADPLMPLLGVALYDGMIAVEDTSFDHFERFSYATCGPTLFREAAVFAPVNYLSPWAVDPRNFGRNLTIGDQVERVAYLRDVHPGQDGIANTIVFDVEGDLLATWRMLPSGLPISCTNTGTTYLFPENPFLLPLAGMTAACAEPNLNGYVWTPNSGECFATLDIEKLGTGTPPTHIRYFRADYTLDFNSAPVAEFLAVDAASSTINYATNAALATPSLGLKNNFLVYWEPNSSIPRQMHVSVHYGRVGATLYFLVPFDFGLGTPVVSRNQSGSQPITEVFSASALINSTQDAWYKLLAPRTLYAPYTWQAPHTLIGKVVVDQGVADAISEVVNDPAVASFFDGDIAHFYIQ